MSEHRKTEMPVELLREMAAAVAVELRAAAGGTGGEPISGTGGGSLHRALPADLHARFIEVRTALFRRGIHDPVLARFDTASASQAPTSEIAEQLATLAGAL